MISVLTVCGNGIGSSLMLKMKIEEICAENGIDAQVESIDFNAAQGRKADLIVTVKELAEQFDDKNVKITEQEYDSINNKLKSNNTNEYIDALDSSFSEIKINNYNSFPNNSIDKPDMLEEYLKNYSGVILYDENNLTYPLSAIYTKKLLPILEKMREKKNYKLKDIFENKNCLKLSMKDLEISKNYFININTFEDYEKYIK